MVDRCAADGESGSHRDFLFRPHVWTRCRRQISERITSVISMACHFTTKSGGICDFPHSRWVATRRGLHKPVSSSPPFRTGLAPLRASGSTPLISLHGVTMKRRFPFRQFHRCPPVYSLRVHWVPLFPSSQRLGAFAVSSHPGVPSFPGL